MIAVHVCNLACRLGKGTTMFNILLVEDDPQVNKATRIFLEQNGYRVAPCLDARAAYDALYGVPFDLVVSDIMMPGVDGYELARSIRLMDERTPILFVTARDDLVSKERGFRMGIDDYLVKPIDLHELLWHVEALLRRAGVARDQRALLGAVELNAGTRECTCGGRDVKLTAREFDILFKLVSNPRQAFTRAQLMGEYWDAQAAPRAVDVHITHLRNKLGDSCGVEIKAVYGIGYKAVPA